MTKHCSAWASPLLSSLTKAEEAVIEEIKKRYIVPDNLLTLGLPHGGILPGHMILNAWRLDKLVLLPYHTPLIACTRCGSHQFFLEECPCVFAS